MFSAAVTMAAEENSESTEDFKCFTGTTGWGSGGGEEGVTGSITETMCDTVGINDEANSCKWVKTTTKGK